MIYAFPRQRRIVFCFKFTPIAPVIGTQFFLKNRETVRRDYQRELACLEKIRNLLLKTYSGIKPVVFINDGVEKGLIDVFPYFRRQKRHAVIPFFHDVFKFAFRHFQIHPASGYDRFHHIGMKRLALAGFRIHVLIHVFTDYRHQGMSGIQAPDHAYNVVDTLKTGFGIRYDSDFLTDSFYRCAHIQFVTSFSLSLTFPWPSTIIRMAGMARLSLLS